MTDTSTPVDLDPDRHPAGIRLLCTPRHRDCLTEVTLHEWSPSWQHVRLTFAASEKTAWVQRTEYMVVEVLPAPTKK